MKSNKTEEKETPSDPLTWAIFNLINQSIGYHEGRYGCHSSTVEKAKKQLDKEVRKIYFSK